ncbi:MAG TPA: hypothetical protein EYP68_08425 [Candidatus Korarchaeota archaeon]|nr:hypothetical protein [Candidatus Korarchaeota archaeon]
MEDKRDIEYWSWERCCSKIKSLKGRLGFKYSDKLRFLRLSLSLNDGSVEDELIAGRKLHPYVVKGIYCILCGYIVRDLDSSLYLGSLSYATFSWLMSFSTFFLAS